MSVGLGGLRHLDDPRTSPRGVSDPVVVANDLSMGLGGRSKISLPPDASCTLFVEGLPANCTRREVARILYIHDMFSNFPFKFCSFTSICRYISSFCRL